MLNRINKNLKSSFKQLSNIHSAFNSKILVYFGLFAYWSVILVGTFLNFN